MKRIAVFINIALLIALLVGCTKPGTGDANEGTDQQTVQETTQETNQEDTQGSTQESIQDYFPMKKNVKYYYEGEGNEYATYTVYNDYIEENRIQQRVNNGGTVLAKVIELKDGELTVLLSREETYHRENLLKTEGDKAEVLLKEPIAKGTSWKLSDSRVRTITDLEVDINTLSGDYKAIEVTTEGNGSKTLDYYAKDVGLVKSIFIQDEIEVSSTLSKLEENVPLVQEVNFYYPNINDNKYYSIKREISFETNDITRKVLESA
jgi:hypothetical protein